MLKKLFTLALGVLLSSSLMAQTPVQLVSATSTSPTTVAFQYADGHRFLLDFYGPNIVRFFQDPNDGMPRNPQAQPPAEILVKNPRKCPGKVELTQTEGEYTVKTSQMTVKIDRRNAHIAIFDGAGKKVVCQTGDVKFDNGKAQLVLSGAADEEFYGGGVQNGRFAHKGQAIAIENTNNWVDGGVASPTPFYWSSKGYGVMFHTFKPGRYDFGKTTPGEVQLEHSDSYLDVFFMVDDTPVKLLSDFYQLTGNPILMPKFGFYEGHLNAYNRDYWKEAAEGQGIQYPDGKWYSESQKDNGGVKESLNGEKDNYQFSARAAIDRYLKNGMPLGWFLPNDGYGAGYGQTPTLEGNVENLRQFGEYARAKGVEIGLWTQSDLHPKEGVEALLQRDIVREVRDAGVRILKTDVAWVGAGYSFGLNGVSDVGEIMPYYGNNARPFIISLDGWAGTQRYAGIWSGDQTGGDWEYIRFHIPTFIGSGLSGQPNITSDVDGIFGGKNIPVNVREFQWKTFTPMELNMDGWGANPKYPDALGEPATSINRLSLLTKSSLMPYTYNIAREAVTGKPMIRAMFLEDSTATKLPLNISNYQYMYGPSLLVAPIYQATQADNEGNDIRNGIYLPEGLWYDFFGAGVYRGGRIINNFDAPLWKLPVFVKSGAIMPKTAAHLTPKDVRHDLRDYVVYPDGKTAYVDYDDDGRTEAYKMGEFVETKVECDQKGKKVTVRIAPTTGSYKGFVPNKRTTVTIPCAAKPKKVTMKVNGKKPGAEADWNFYEAGELKVVESLGIVTKCNPQIVVDFGSCDVTKNDFEVEIDGWQQIQPAELKGHGALTQPQLTFEEANVQADAITPSWKKMDNADYYEVEFQGLNYSDIKDTQLRFGDLTSETPYTFKLRAVNADGAGPWAEKTVNTIVDPLKWAVKGIKASLTCEDQPGQTVAKLFDLDVKSGWHTKWGKGEAIPFEMTIDLRAVNTLDRLVYQPRDNAGNGTLLKGRVSYSVDRINWSEPEAFTWARDNSDKTIAAKGVEARYIKLYGDESVGNFGSGNELFVFRAENTEPRYQGDINRDKRVDENDFTSYMNYTGLRTVDSDFDYVSIGDINGNGLIDAYDISVVSTELDGGVYANNNKVSGSLVFTPNVKKWAAGDEVLITVSGKALHFVNGLSMALPYAADKLEYKGVELKNMKEMVNLTYDRLHSNGQKELHPTFVNRGNNFLLDEGDSELFVIKFKALKAGGWNDLKFKDIMLVDRNLNTINQK